MTQGRTGLPGRAGHDEVVITWVRADVQDGLVATVGLDVHCLAGQGPDGEHAAVAGWEPSGISLMANIAAATSPPMLPGADGRPMSLQIAASALFLIRTSWASRSRSGNVTWASCWWRQLQYGAAVSPSPMPMPVNHVGQHNLPSQQYSSQRRPRCSASMAGSAAPSTSPPQKRSITSAQGPQARRSGITHERST
jgi:hypothetical protein